MAFTELPYECLLVNMLLQVPYLEVFILVYCKELTVPSSKLDAHLLLYITYFLSKCLRILILEVQ